SPGDVVFDIEGDPFWEPARGLHFLFDQRLEGVPLAGPVVGPERHAFETLVDFFTERLARHPDLHVYHYGAYEPTALKQLMGVYATREDAVDALLRHEIFVDLHSLLRQGLRAGVPGYSLKEVEALPAFQRQAEVRSGTRAVLAYEQWMDTQETALLGEIAIYNEEDCQATLALRDWLVDHRPDEATWAAGPAARPADEDKQQTDAQRAALREALLDGAEPGSPRWLTAELLEYHRREARPAWWWFFARCQMSVDELVEDGEAIGRLTPAGAVSGTGRQRFTFPPQQHKLAPGDAPVDPATRKGAGTIEELDETTGVLVLRRAAGLASAPAALIPPGPFDTRAQRGALARFGASVLAGDHRYRALEDIVARARPRLIGGFSAALQTMDIEAQRERAAALDESYLFIQGPPGTGKTWTGARIVVELIRRGRRVGVAATSHKAIHNLLDQIEAAAREDGVSFRGLKKCSAGSAETEYRSDSITSVGDLKKLVAAAPRVQLLAGTAWLFAHEALDGGALVDTLVIDEAGQVALAD